MRLTPYAGIREDQPAGHAASAGAALDESRHCRICGDCQ